MIGEAHHWMKHVSSRGCWCTCTCGWASLPLATMEAATAAFEAHLLDVGSRKS